MISINLQEVKKQLYSNEKIQKKILNDYSIAEEPSDPESFSYAIVNALGQLSVDNPMEQYYDNSKVFKAATWAIASNSRPWRNFLKNKNSIANRLNNYDPEKAYMSFQTDLTLEQKIKMLLPGQSSSNDAKAIGKWATLLHETPNFYEFIKDLGNAFRKLSNEEFSFDLTDPELLLCLVGFLADPPHKWQGIEYLADQSIKIINNGCKLPGMRYALASEFLRNLGWNGFKPDRHIQRLFDIWFSGLDRVDSKKINTLQQLIGRSNKDLRGFLNYSLIGIATSPKGEKLSEVDNLVWLLAVYIEIKGKESDSEKYVIK